MLNKSYFMHFCRRTHCFSNIEEKLESKVHKYPIWVSDLKKGPIIYQQVVLKILKSTIIVHQRPQITRKIDKIKIE